MPPELALGYRFSDPGLLALALTHRSVSSEDNSRSDNERLEFLGDAVLQLAITDRLYSEFPDLPEGQMAKVRAAVVSGETLAEVARTLDLGRYLEVSPSEERSGGRDKDSMLADALEAVIGAIYLDSGFEAAETFVHRCWGGRIAQKATNPGSMDFKTRLQEEVAAAGKRPVYEVSGEGPDHDMNFTAKVKVDGRLLGEGQGRSKKAAEQSAAEKALAALDA